MLSRLNCLLVFTSLFLLIKLSYAKRVYMSYQTTSLPMTVANRCGVWQDNQGFGTKGCPEVDIVGNWAQINLDEEKCKSGCGWTACMKGSVCTIKNAFGAPIYTVSCSPKGSSSPAPIGGFVTTYSCANQQNI